MSGNLPDTWKKKEGIEYTKNMWCQETRSIAGTEISSEWLKLRIQGKTPE